jgi:hypothetical protein
LPDGHEVPPLSKPARRHCKHFQIYPPGIDSSGTLSGKNKYGSIIYTLKGNKAIIFEKKCANIPVFKPLLNLRDLFLKRDGLFLFLHAAPQGNATGSGQKKGRKRKNTFFLP